jgi:hypothetical protein
MIIVSFVMANPQPARACSCQSGVPADLLGASDLAFIGNVIDQQLDFAGTSTESLFAVDRVVKGDVTSSVIVTAETDTECGAALAEADLVGVTANRIPGEVLPHVCTWMDPAQMIAAADELGLGIVAPLAEELATSLPQSTSNYAAAIPLSIALSLVFLGAVALGTRTSSMSSR